MATACLGQYSVLAFVCARYLLPSLRPHLEELPVQRYHAVHPVHLPYYIALTAVITFKQDASGEQHYGPAGRRLRRNGQPTVTVSIAHDHDLLVDIIPIISIVIASSLVRY